MRVRTLILLLSALLACLCATAQNESQIEAQKRVIANLERQIAEQERELTKIKQGRSASETKVKQFVRQIEARNRLLSVQLKQARELSAELRKAENTTLQLNRNLDKNKQLYAEMVREAYRNYKHENYLTYLFSAQDFTDMAQKIANLRHITEARRTKLHEISTLKERVVAQKTELDHRKQEVDKAAAALRDQRVKLERDATSARKEVNRMSQQERNRLKQKMAREQQLSVAISDLRKLTRGNKEGDSFSTKTAGLRLPVSAGRVRRYMENMAEIVGPQGAQVTSIYEGKVIEVKRNRITDKFDVYVAHGEYVTSYANLGTILVEKGQKVSKNQGLGTLGASVNISNMETEYKLIFGIFSPNPAERMLAETCFRK